MKKRFDPVKKEKERLQKRVQTIEAKIDRLVELRLEGSIDKERYEGKYNQLEDDLLFARNDFNEADKEKVDLLGEFQFSCQSGGFLADSQPNATATGRPTAICRICTPDAQNKKSNPPVGGFDVSYLAPPAGLEPATHGLTVHCSTN